MKFNILHRGSKDMRYIFSSKLIIIFAISFLLIKNVSSQNTRIEVNVGVVLDMETWIGKMGFSCISMALSDLYASSHGKKYKTRLVLHVRDSKQDVVGAASAALDLIKNVEVQAIIGPISSMQTKFIIDLGDKAHVPIFTFSATSPSLSSSKSRYFFRACLDDSSQVQAISAIIHAFGWREVVPIYVDNEYGEGVIPFITDALQVVDVRVPYRSIISPHATDDQLETELFRLMTMQTRVFIVHMLHSLSSRLFEKAEKIGMMSEGYVWIVTDGTGNGFKSINSSVITDSMQGVLGLRPYVWKSKLLDEFKVRWRRNFQRDNPNSFIEDLNIFGLWAYDAALALAMAVEKINSTDFRFLQNTGIPSNSTDLETLGTSPIGPILCQELSNIRLQGLTGDFHLVDGQLQSSSFELFNVNGDGLKGIGFWTPANGISRKLNLTSTTPYSTSKDSLKPIIWPGETISVPKGWVIPTNGKRLRIGVPMKIGFSQFVTVSFNTSTKTTSVTGYCIDVFKAVIEALPYAVSYDFIPFAQPDGTSSGSYNDLAYQVYLKKYDAVVGDLTIVSNRSNYVDFTQPYTESGVSMIVPIKDNRSKNPWVFLKPLTWDLWLTSACFFVFIGFVIWLLEHRINDDFRGPPSHQAGMILWFSFSTMVFAHKEKVLSNLARFVVIVWVFVVLILIQSYTASLTSMLTVQQLKPTFTDVNDLIKRGEKVGYQKGSFVFELLKKMNFDKKNLKEYNSIEECDDAFSNGSAKGGIAAAFDETPYMRLFLGHYCSKYTMAGPVYKTGGFGFAFAKGSPLVSDVSRAILTVTESDVMVGIEKAWFGTQTSCEDSSPNVSSNSLGLDSFWGLFLIAGIASVSAFLIYVISFLYEHRRILLRFDPNTSIWKRMIIIFQHYDNKDLSSHTFRTPEMRNRGIINSSGASPTHNFPQSPCFYSTHTNSNFISVGGQGSPLAEPSPYIRSPFQDQERVRCVQISEIVHNDEESSPAHKEHHTMIDIAKLLAQRGMIVTIISTPLNTVRFRDMISRATEVGLDMRVVELKLGCEEAGLPEGCENFDMLPTLSLGTRCEISRIIVMKIILQKTIPTTITPTPTKLVPRDQNVVQNLYFETWRSSKDRNINPYRKLVASSQARETWFCKKIKRAKQCSEILARPNLKNFILKFTNDCNKKRRIGFTYDMKSYALNFDDDVHKNGD